MHWDQPNAYIDFHKAANDVWADGDKDGVQLNWARASAKLSEINALLNPR
jgi:hypothetical protein